MKGTTNIELIELAKCLSIPNFYCICKDEFNTVKSGVLSPSNGLSFRSPRTKGPLNIVVNLNDSDKNVNGHWCLCFIDSKQKIYYSSYGDPIPVEVKKFMMEVDDRLILSSNFQIQHFNEDTCGLYCILILFLLNDKLKFEDIIISFV